VRTASASPHKGRQRALELRDRVGGVRREGSAAWPTSCARSEQRVARPPRLQHERRRRELGEREVQRGVRRATAARSVGQYGPITSRPKRRNASLSAGVSSRASS
jgi:hypothetical protein